MNWFINLSTRAKLFLSFAVVIAFMLVVIITAVRGISSIRAYQDEIFASEGANTIDIFEFKALNDDVRVNMLRMLNTSGRPERESIHKKILDESAEAYKLLRKLLDVNRDELPLYTRIDELNKIFNQYREVRDNQVLPLILDGKLDRAKALIYGIQAQRYDHMREATEELEKQIRNEAEHHIQTSKDYEAKTIRSFVIIGALAAFASFLIALFLNKITAKPLTDISVMAESISSGDLNVNPLHIDRHDEIGSLARTFSNMVQGLKKQTKDILEAVSVLASSSNEIAATTAELASGTEQTAVAVSETTTTVEEVKQTANISSQKAKHVSDLAQTSVTVSQSGARLVNDTISGIANIREQMEYIAETIVRLSEHNQAISEIIATVDDLSEQSNLLAVNASIEASKAGEHGKGFIVVAQEIKSLAEQSKQATKQVRTILNDIQKSSTAAVMATEKGSKAVEAAVTQSSGTGEAIQELSRSISEASQAVLQIAASNQQQLVGMDQVALAMTNIKQASTQNASSTKQVEITVRGLQDLGQKLKRLVELYRI